MSKLNITKYDYIKQNIIDTYASLSDENVKLPTVRELMKQYNVSYSTISRVLLDLENENLIIRKHGKGIFINKIKEKRLLILALPLFQRIDYFIWGIIQGVMKESKKLDFTTIILNSNMRITKNLKSIIKETGSGVIFFPSDDKSISDEYANFLINNKVKFLFLDRFLNDKIIRVVNNHFDAMTELGNFIFRKSFKRVYFVYANKFQLKLTSVKDKINGLLKGLNGTIKFRSVPIYTFYNIAMKLNLDNVFIVANDDFLLMDIVDFYKKNNKIVKNISGYGNLFPHNYMTVDQNSIELGKKSIEILYKVLQNKKLKSLEYKQKCKIIYR